MFLLITPVALDPPMTPGGNAWWEEMSDDEVQQLTYPKDYPTLVHDEQTLVNLDCVERFEVISVMTSVGPFMLTRLHGVRLIVSETIHEISRGLANGASGFLVEPDMTIQPNPFTRRPKIDE